MSYYRFNTEERKWRCEMGGFYVKDRQVMGWLHYWVLYGAPVAGRPLLADQLRRVRKRHGSGVAREYRDHLVWVGSYPVR